MNVPAEIRRLKARIWALEQSRRRPKRQPAPRPNDSLIAARERLWARYVVLDVGRRGRITKLNFAMRHHLNPTEFCRFFSETDRRGIPEGSEPAQNFYAALRDAIAELEGRKSTTQVVGFDSHGNALPSQYSAARPQ